MAATVMEHRVGELRDGADEGSLIVSASGLRVAYTVTHPSSRKVVVIDDNESPGYRDILNKGLSFSLDSQRTAWAAQLESGNWAVVVDGAPAKEYESVGPAPIPFSPDSKRVAYCAAKNRRIVAVVDGVESRPYDKTKSHPTFSPDAKRVAYAALRDGKWRMVLDGKEGKAYDAIPTGRILFSPNCSRTAYTARDGGEQFFVVVNGSEGRKYMGIGQEGAVFTPDSRHVAYVAARPVGPALYGKFQPGSFVAVLDDAEGEKYRSIESLCFSSDSHHLAYAAARGKVQMLVVDGRQGDETARVTQVKFSPNAQTLAFCCASFDGRWVVLVDEIASGRKVPPAQTIEDKIQDGMSYEGVAKNSIVFSPDSRRVAFSALRHPHELVVVDDTDGPRFDEVWTGGIVFSAGGEHVAYWARKARRWVIVANHTEVSDYDSFVPGCKIVFDSPNSFYTLARKTRDILRVNVDLR